MLSTGGQSGVFGQSDLHYLTNSPRQGIYAVVKQRDFSVGSCLRKATDDRTHQAKGKHCNIAIHNHQGRDLPRERVRPSEDAATIRNKCSLKLQCSYTGFWGGMSRLPGSCGWRAQFKSLSQFSKPLSSSETTHPQDNEFQNSKGKKSYLLQNSGLLKHPRFSVKAGIYKAV